MVLFYSPIDKTAVNGKESLVYPKIAEKLGR